MSDARPRMPIRRFDVFAEYSRQQAEEDGVPPDEAAGYGLWVAKVVAARKFGRSMSKKSPAQVHAEQTAAEGAVTGTAPSKWHTLDGTPQTDALFEHDIVDRMGRSFYADVFAPAIAEARREGKSYQGIRDSIRRDWTPAPPASKSG